MTYFQDVRCWDQNRVGIVINTQALNIDEDLFLATHTPFDYLEFVDSARVLADGKETTLLAELLRGAQDGEHGFVAVQGVPGTGKSNLIRWLYLRYRVMCAPTDRVLLIERADNSLRNTLLCVMQLFEGRFEEERQLIENANTQLEGPSLREAILSSFHTLATAMASGHQKLDVMPPDHIVSNVPGFLLDQTVRAHLIATRIDVIARQLIGADERPDEMPEFIPDDFRLSIASLRKIRESNYGDVKELAEELYDDEQTRQDLASYLNRLMSEALGRTVSLTPGDLKRMFAELRKELYQRGESLVLFIEDITAFSGLDAGLVDVLATEHRGGTGLCRLSSVIGITDNYYNERFPDNLRDRLTLRVLLPPPTQNPTFLRDLAARHLNAMRVTGAQLSQWAITNADLPVACDVCPARTMCHPAFGAVSVTESQSIGLYPFNERALSTMFERLEGQGKTPRSFLRHILHMVLQTHGGAIPIGQFPPSPDKVGSKFTPPPLQKPAQRGLLNRLTPLDRGRVESLVLYWGDRTLDTHGTGAERLLGGLKLTVFEVFRVPIIDGEYAEPLIEVTNPPTTSAVATAPNVVRRGTYFEEIEAWLTTGAKLDHYSELSKRIRDLVRDAIDWELYSISTTQVTQRLTPTNFFIEGQTSSRQPEIPFVLKRTPETAFLLHALDDLNSSNSVLTEEGAATHLTTLSLWIALNTDELVAFVQESNLPVPLLDMLANLYVWGAWLNGLLNRQHNSSERLFGLLVEQREKPWPRSETRSSQWDRLTKSVDRFILGDSRTPVNIRNEFFLTLNRAQGGVTELKFLDAATALDALDRTAMQMLPVDLSVVQPLKNSVWEVVIGAYEQLYQFLQQAADEELHTAQGAHTRLRELVEDDRPQDIVDAIQKIVDAVKTAHRTMSFQIDPEFTPNRLSSLLRDLERGLAAQNSELWLWLSSAANSIERAKRFADYLSGFIAAVEKFEDTLIVRDARVAIDSAIDTLTAEYTQLLRRLENVQ